MKSIRECATLNSGVKMPWLGLGVFKLDQGKDTEQAIRWAVELGYRSIDTAAVYENEASVGRAVRECGIPRNEVFITSKVWNTDHGYDATLGAFEASLARLEMDYLDLYLIHWPVPGKFRETWRALETLLAEERVRAIGVSNFLVHHLEDLLESAQVVPAINQVEFHPYLQQPELQEFCRTRDIRLEAWSPIARGRLAGDAKLIKIGKQYGKTAVQVALRWELQRGIVVIPKSAHRERIESNADIFDFELYSDDMEAIDALDRGERFGPDPDNFRF